MKEKMLLALLLTLIPAGFIYAADYRDPATGMEFVFVKGGCFKSSLSEICLPDFLIGRYEVTQAQWKAVMGNNPSHFKSCGGSCPVEQVSARDAQDFIDRLNAKTGKTYRLPAESEWEYAARSGGQPQRWAGTDDPDELKNCAWYEANAGGKTHPVGQKKPNALGLYDMSGNVWEWVTNRAEGNAAGSGLSSAVMSGGMGTLRGGSWQDGPADLEAGKPGWVEPILRTRMVGFRVAISADQLPPLANSTKTK